MQHHDMVHVSKDLLAMFSVYAYTVVIGKVLLHRSYGFGQCSCGLGCSNIQCGFILINFGPSALFNNEQMKPGTCWTNWALDLRGSDSAFAVL